MNEVLAQLPALLGVILGAAGTIAASAFADRGRWTRGMTVRWDERRLAAYIEYASTLKDIISVLMRMTAENRPESLSRPMDREAGHAALAESESRRTRVWEQVLLLGDPPTIEAARAWRTEVRRLEQLAARRTYSHSEWQSLVERVDHARDRFYAAARGGLAVPGGAISTAAWNKLPVVTSPATLESGM